MALFERLKNWIFPGSNPARNPEPSAAFLAPAHITKERLWFSSIPQSRRAMIFKVCALLDPMADISKWLPKGHTEDTEQYKTRLELSNWSPRCHEMLDMYVGALTEREPTIVAESSDSATSDQAGKASKPEARGRLADAEGKTSWVNKALEQVIPHGLVALVGERRIQATQDKSSPDAYQTPEDVAASKEFVSVFGAEQILDWQFGEDSKLSMVKLTAKKDLRPQWFSNPCTVDRFFIYKMEAPAPAQPAEGDAIVAAPISATPPQRKLTLEVYDIYPDGSIYIVPSPVPAFDEIPVALVDVRAILHSIANNDMANQRAASNRDWDIYLHQHPHMTLTSPPHLYPHRVGKPIPFGPTNVTLLMGSDGTNAEEKFAPVVTNGDSIQQQNAVLSERNAAIDHAMGSAPADAQAAAPTSGLALMVRYRTSAKRLVNTVATALENAENFLAKLMGRATVQWPKDIVISPVDEANEHEVVMDSLRGLPEAQRVVKEGYTWRVINRNRLSPERIALIEKNLKDWTPGTLDQALGGRTPDFPPPPPPEPPPQEPVNDKQKPQPAAA